MEGNTLITTTLSVVLFTLVGCGFVIDKLLTKYNLIGMHTSDRAGLANQVTDFYNSNAGIDLGVEDTGHGRESVTVMHQRACCHRTWKKFEISTMKPLFGGALTDRTYVVDDNHRGEMPANDPFQPFNPAETSIDYSF